MTTCLVARIYVGLVWSRIVGGLSCSSVGERCSFVVERCSFVDGQLERVQERGQSVDSCNSGLGLVLDGGLGLNDHLLGILGCSIFHHKIHRRIGLKCHIDRRSWNVQLGLVDIVAEHLVE